MPTFSDRERSRFVRNGFLVLRDAVDDDLIAAADDAVRDALDVDPDDPEALIGAGYTENLAEEVDREPFAAIDEQVFEYADALVGEGELQDPSGYMQVALQFPDDDADADYPAPRNASGHLDGFKNFDSNPEVGPGTVAASVYVDDVVPRGGGFTVWPGSHLVAGKYFENHALETVGGKPNNSQVPAIDPDGEAGWDYDDLLWNQYDPLEVYGDAGTVVLWHFRLTHTAGINRSPNLRMAAISRYRHREDREDFRDAAAHPFKYWPAMDDVGPVPRAGADAAAAADDD